MARVRERYVEALTPAEMDAKRASDRPRRAEIHSFPVSDPGKDRCSFLQNTGIQHEKPTFLYHVLDHR